MSAQQEADRRWPADHEVSDPDGETGYACSDPYGYDETANRAGVEMALWAVAETDSRVEAMARSISSGRGISPDEFWAVVGLDWRNECRSMARAALAALRADVEGTP
jgi:hypothetical protein